MSSRILIRNIFDIVRDIVKRLILLVVNLVPGTPGNSITDACKRKLLSLLGVHVGVDSQVSSGLYVFCFGRVRFGRECSIGSNFQIWNFADVCVGDRLLASHNVTVICGTHSADVNRFNIAGPVNIGNDVWIGANVLIVGPATIGDGAIIGANSFVSGMVPAGGRYGGSPAKSLSSREFVAESPAHGN